MKVLEIITDTNIGGAGVLLVNRLRHTNLNKYRTCVLLPKGSRLIERIRETGVPYVEMDCQGDKSFDTAAITKYINVIRRIKPDIINTHGCLTARIAAKLCRVPVKICTRHCVYPVKNSYRYIKPLVGVLNSSLSDCFIAVAYSAKKNLEELGVRSNRVTVIINGAEPLRILDNCKRRDIRSSLGISESTCVLIMCARLEECKGHAWFFDVMKRLKSNGRSCVALLVGDGSMRQELMKLCKEKGIDDRVIFTGFTDDVAKYMNIAHININCSIGTETSSLALSEGMSIGLPAVVGDYGGNPYMIKNGVNGFVCKCKDSEAMAVYIERLIDDRDLYRRMSRAAKERFASELNARAMTQKTNLLYDKLYSLRIKQK